MREKRELLKIFALDEVDIVSDFNQWNSDEEQKKYFDKVSSQIGWIIIGFNRIEWQLNEIVKKYLCNEFPEINSLFFENIANNGFSSKVHLLKTFFKQYYLGDKKHIFDCSDEFGDFNKDVDTTFNALKDIAELRNKYAHCFWHRTDENQFVEFRYRFKANLGLETVFIRFNNDDLRKDFENLNKAEELLLDFESKFDEIHANT